MNILVNAYGFVLTVFFKVHLIRHSYIGILITSDHPAMKQWLEYQTSYLIFQSNLVGLTFVFKFLQKSYRKYKLDTHSKTMRMNFKTILST